MPGERINVEREIVVPEGPDEVWESLTDPERLEEWFASDVELDARPGGEGVFRWGDGDERRVVVRELEEDRRLVLDWDDGGSCRDRARARRRRDTRARRRVLAGVRPGLRAARLRVDGARGGVDRVFAALGDAGRRSLVEAVATRGTATATELAAELPVTRQAVAKQLSALADAGLLRATRAGRETRYEVTPAPLEDAVEWMVSVGAAWDERLAALRRSLAKKT